jgi:hypothetical protein
VKTTQELLRHASPVMTLGVYAKAVTQEKRDAQAPNLALLRSPYSTIFGHRMLLFDLGGTIASVCMFATAILLTVRHTTQLYREEPLA